MVIRFLKGKWTFVIAAFLVAMLLCPLVPSPVQAAVPAITAVDAVSIADTSAVIVWNTDVAATSQVVYSTTSHLGNTYGNDAAAAAQARADYGSNTVEDATLGTSHGQLLWGLTVKTQYHYRVISRDSAGDYKISDEYSFTTRAFNISSVAAGSITDEGATITWTTSVNATSNVEYGTDTSYGDVAPVVEDTTADKTSHIVSLSGLDANTTYHYHVKSTDGSGNTEYSVDKTFTTLPDTTPPQITLQAETSITTTTGTVNWTTIKGATSQVAYSETSHAVDPGWANIAEVLAAYGDSTVEDGTFVTSHSEGLSGLNPGTTYYYRALSKDPSGNEAWSAEDSFATPADTTPPVISSVASSAITSTSATITWGTDEGATSQVEYGTTSTTHGNYDFTTAVDATLVTSHSVDLDALVPGTTYYYRVISQDFIGNEAVSDESSFTTLADTTPPVISAETATSITDSGATIEWDTNEAATSQVVYSTTSHAGPFADGAAARAAYGSFSPEDATLLGSHSVALGGLSASTTYYYRVISRDAAGNEAVSAERSFDTVADTTPPVISGETETGITDQSATIGWNTNEPATSQVEYGTTSTIHGGYDQTTTLDPSLLGAHSVTLTGLTPDTIYYYRVISQDAAGNESVSGERTFTTLADTTPPVITPGSISATGITDKAATITWVTNEPSTTRVEYGLTSTTHGSYDYMTPLNATLDLNHSQSLSGLTASTTYYYRVISEDASGNEVVSDEQSFVTTGDVTPPVISNVMTSGLTTDSANVLWKTNELATSQVVYSMTSQAGPFADGAAARLAYGNWTVEDASLVTDHSQPVGGLTANTKYYYRVISRDAAGNERVSPAEYDFTTLADVVPPLITKLPETSINATTATINWNTDKPADSRVEYGKTTAYGSFSPLDPSLVVVHSVVLSGLDPNTTYHYLIHSSDSAGNASVDGPYTFTTTGDTTPPPTPGLLVPADFLVTGDNKPTFDWTDVNDPSGVTYDLQVSDGPGFGSPVVDQTALNISTFTVDGTTVPPLADGHYWWRVRAVDGAGNASGWTAPWQLTVDTAPPVVTVTSPVAGDVWGGNTTHDITWTADDIAMAANPITIEYFDGGTWVQIATGEANDGVYTWTVPTLNISNARVRVTAVDLLGNTGSGESGDFTIDSTGPVVTIDLLPYHPASPTTTPTFTGTVTDAASAIASVEYRVTAPDGTVEVNWTAAAFTADASDPKTGTYSFTTPALVQAWHLLDVRAYDVAGNQGAVTSYNPPQGFLVTTKPLVKFDDAEPMSAHPPMWVTESFKTRDPSPIFKGEATSGTADIAKVQCRIDGGTWVDAVFTADPADAKQGTWQFSPQPVSDGTHSVEVKAIDAMGQETPADVYAQGGAGYFTFTVDTTPPKVSNVQVSEITDNSVVITWTTDEPATSQVEYGEDTGYGSIAGDDTTLTTEHSVKITGLGWNKEYHFRVKSSDDVGNEGFSPDATFKTSIPVWLYAAAGVAGIIVLAIVLSIAWWVLRRIIR